MSGLSHPMGRLWSMSFLETLRISCGGLVEQVRTLKICIGAIWKFDKSFAGPPSLKDYKWEEIVIHKCLLIPYVPVKDCVQETVSAFTDNHLMMQIGKATELWVLIWHSSMRKAFLIHVGSALDAIERKAYIKAYLNPTRFAQHNAVGSNRQRLN